MTRRFHWVSACALAVATSSCGTLLGVDDFEVDPNFQEEGDDDQATEPEPGVPNFDPDDDADDDTDDDADDDTDDDADDDTDDDADDDTDDDADDDTDDDVNDDTDDDADDDTDDDADDDVEPEPGPDDDGSEAGADDDMPEPECFAPVSGSCDNLPQCGCGEDNCEFDLDDTGATSCVPAGNRAPYAECAATSNQCQVGYSCVGGLCREFCSGEEPTCAQGDYAACLPVSATEGGSIPEFFACARTCDPRDPTSEEDGNLACGVGVTCVPGDDGVSNCYATTASRAAGQSCADEYGYPDPLRCAPGLGCSEGLDGVPTCQPYCQVGSEDCGPGAQCLSFVPSLLAGDVEIGTCLFCENVPLDGECAYWPQCGCDDGEMCYPGADFYTATCMPAAAGQLNDVCSPDAPCGPGLDCLGFTYIEPFQGVCTQFCQEAVDCPSYETVCLDLGYLGGTGDCLWTCDPRDPQNYYYPFSACGTNQACIPLYGNGAAICSPLSDSVRGLGAGCTGNLDCEAGLGCSYGACTEWCAIGAPDCTSASSSCFENYAAVSGGLTFGLCSEATLSLTTADPATPIPDNGSIVSTITAPTSAYPSRITVEVDIQHAYVGDLRLELRAPDGTLVVLLSGTSLSNGADLTGTRFDDNGGDMYYDGLPPYQGAFQPETPLEVLNGNDILGVWTLTVIDDAAVDAGTLNSWTLHFW